MGSKVFYPNLGKAPGRAKPETEAKFVGPIPQENQHRRMTRPFGTETLELCHVQGTYGTVFRGTLRDGTEVAIKVPTKIPS